MTWLLNRLKEPSTWRAIFCLAGICGYSIAPELQSQIVTIVGAALAMVEFIRKEKTNETTKMATAETTTSTESVSTDNVGTGSTGIITNSTNNQSDYNP